MTLFDDDFVYPSDRDGGTYVEFVGLILDVRLALDDYWRMLVRTDKGEFTGWMPKVGTFEPMIGYYARIRVYRAGGGHYPDNKITSVSTTREFM